MDSVKPKVYFVGASGVGKTTLARWVATTFNLPLLSGATKNALLGTGLSFELITSDPSAGEAYQAEVWRHQLELERPYWEGEGWTGRGFVSDRGPDLLAYTSEVCRTVWQMVRAESFEPYMRRLREEAVVFFVRPHPEVVAAPDGRRDHFLEPRLQGRVDGVIQFILNAHDVPYIPVDTPKLLDRQRLVGRVLSLAFRR